MPTHALLLLALFATPGLPGQQTRPPQPSPYRPAPRPTVRPQEDSSVSFEAPDGRCLSVLANNGHPPRLGMAACDSPGSKFYLMTLPGQAVLIQSREAGTACLVTDDAPIDKPGSLKLGPCAGDAHTQQRQFTSVPDPADGKRTNIVDRMLKCLTLGSTITMAPCEAGNEGQSLHVIRRTSQMPCGSLLPDSRTRSLALRESDLQPRDG